VPVGDRARLDERQRAGEGVLVLAGEPRDQVGTDGGVGQQLADHGQAFRRQGRIVAAAHRPQDAIIDRLKWHVQMRTDRRRCRHQPDERFGHLVGIDGRQADAVEAILLHEGIEQPDEIDPGLEVVPPPPEVHAGEDHLAEAAGRERLELGEDRPRREAATSPPGHRHDAERAEEIAPLLHLEERPRLAIERARPERAHHRLPPAVANLDARDPLRRVRRRRGLDERIEPVEPDHVVHRIDRRRGPRLRLRVATRQDDARRRIGAARPARQPAALRIGGVRHGAGVDDDDVCRRPHLDEDTPRRTQAIRDGRRVVGVHLAAERGDRDAWSAHATSRCSSRTIQPPPTTRSPR
jgi:hypothetical protein